MKIEVNLYSKIILEFEMIKSKKFILNIHLWSVSSYGFNPGERMDFVMLIGAAVAFVITYIVVANLWSPWTNAPPGNLYQEN